jgi:hypothetical protein
MTIFSIGNHIWKGDRMSPDITMCSPTKYLKKCDKCYRRNAKAKPDEWQSYSNFYDACKNNKWEYFIKDLPKDWGKVKITKKLKAFGKKFEELKRKV